MTEYTATSSDYRMLRLPHKQLCMDATMHVFLSLWTAMGSRISYNIYENTHCYGQAADPMLEMPSGYNMADFALDTVGEGSSRRWHNPR